MKEGPINVWDNCPKIDDKEGGNHQESVQLAGYQDVVENGNENGVGKESCLNVLPLLGAKGIPKKQSAGKQSPALGCIAPKPSDKKPASP